MKPLCRETLERVYLYLDGEALSESERVEIEVHLKECAPCYERYGLETEMTALLARVKHSCTCPDGLKSKIVALLHQT